MTEIVVLGDDRLELRVLPALGARLHSMRFAGHELLRTPADPDSHADDPFFWGAFVMAPWCNRITPGPVELSGRRVDLQPNFRDGTAIHGQVYRAEWRQTGDAAFAIEGGGGGWPWRYLVEQEFRIERQRVEILQRLTNLDDVPMLGGLGLHPWFVGDPRIAINSALVYPSNKESIARPIAVSGDLDLRRAGQMAKGVDATWSDVADPAVDLYWPSIGIHARMRSTAAARHIVAANPADGEALAVEPQTHAPQGLRRVLNGEPGALEWIAAGASLEHSIDLDFDFDGRAGDLDFDTLIAAAIERLPPEFRRRLESVAIVVDDYPTPAQLAATGAQGLFGLYEGVPRTAFGADGAPVASKITLFRMPLTAHHPDPEELAAAVERTLFHEIAHHMGISDARLVELARDHPPERR